MNTSNNNRKDLLKTLIDLFDGIVEVFLASLIEPLLTIYSQVDHGIDRFHKHLVHQYQGKLPLWILRQGTITYARIGLTLPTVILLSWQCSFLASIAVMTVLSASFWERAVPDLGTDPCVQGDGDKSEEGEEESFGKCHHGGWRT